MEVFPELFAPVKIVNPLPLLPFGIANFKFVCLEKPRKPEMIRESITIIARFYNYFSASVNYYFSVKVKILTFKYYTTTINCQQ